MNRLLFEGILMPVTVLPSNGRCRTIEHRNVISTFQHAAKLEPDESLENVKDPYKAGHVEALSYIPAEEA